MGERGNRALAEKAIGRFQLRSAADEIFRVLTRHTSLAEFLTEVSDAISSHFEASAALEVESDRIAISVLTSLDVESAGQQLQSFLTSWWYLKKGSLPVSIMLEYIE